MKRTLAIVTAVALAAGTLAVGQATAQEAPAVPAVPEEPHIVDPAGDANYLNDQGDGTITGDNDTPQDASSVGDILAAWFTADADNLYAHIQTEAPAPGTQALFYRVQADPGSGTKCLWFQAGTTGAGGPAEPVGNLRDTCGAEEVITDGTLAMNEAADGTGIITIAVPRSASEAFANGSFLKAAIATSRNYVVTPARSATAPQIDTTAPGTDYKVVTGKISKPKPPKPPVPKQCKKLKGKKLKRCIKKYSKSKPKKCKAFQPGEAGAEAETVKLTDKATEEKPVEQTVTLEQSVADVTFGLAPGSTTHFNVQADPKAKKTGLYVLVEFPARNDLDLELLHTDGSYAARSHAFNTVIEANGTQVSSTGHGGESTATSEKLVGITTKDCGGWTVEVGNYLGQGGDFAVKLWLGEAVNEPQEPGAETP